MAQLGRVNVLALKIKQPPLLWCVFIAVLQFDLMVRDINSP